MFSLIACCPTLNVWFENDVKDKQGKYEGVYTFQGIIDERNYWVDAAGENAIWYISDFKDWAIGSADKFGTTDRFIRTSNDLEAVCPNNEGYILAWEYRDGNTLSDPFIPTEDIHIKCANEDDFCTSENLCELDEGDCDTHDECQVGLVCGSNNCLDSLGFDSEFDCCFAPNVGDENFCASGIPCGENEGDCDSNHECQAHLVCDIANNCKTSLGFLSDVNCCVNVSNSGCKYK